MRELVFFLEEKSAKALLESLRPRLQPPDTQIPWRYIVFEGKQDLHRGLERKIRYYRNPDARFLVLRDQDRDDCRRLKQHLATICETAGRADTRIRIACRELESFYLGDLAAVELAFGISGLSKRQNSRKFREPDLLQNPSSELEILTGGRYQKVSGSRAMGAHLRVDGSCSRSFLALIRAINDAMSFS